MELETAPGTILVVDDDRVNRSILTRSLTASGHAVDTAENGRVALDHLAGATPDVVLLDVLMPELDGVAVLERMKGDARLRDVPVIMISALDDLAHVVRCIELGAEDYLQKPFEPVLLRARINAAFNKRRLDELERSRVRESFARFLPETIVDEVLARADGTVRLGGERVTATALMIDVRGFTGFAERTPPDRVIDVLNRFHGEMANAVLDNGGTLVTYMGDGLLAVFGAPIESDDHADRAVATAREMLCERLPGFNAWLERQHATRFRVGIGLASGPMMSGQVGSDRRLQYTAIGDPVNTASRLESLTKQLGRALLLSESTRALLRGPLADVVFVDEVTVRGRSAPTRIWTLDGA